MSDSTVHAESTPQHSGGHSPHAVEMPRPTAAPLILSLGLVLLASGLALGTAFLIVGAVVLAVGLGIWIAQLLPGQGHFHEALVEPSLRPKPVTGTHGTVQQLREGMPGYRVRLPEDVHPISAGVKGGIVGGAAILLPALVYGLVSGHGIWYPVNLLAGMVLPGIGSGTLAETVTDLEQFHFSYLVLGILIHVVMSVILGLMYGVLLPTLPPIPRGVAWSALFMPTLWTGASYVLLGVVNPVLRDGLSWPWFILSQFVFGVVLATVAFWAGGLGPVRSGLLGGAVGGVFMAGPALFWALASGNGIWYPVNLLAGMVLPGVGAQPPQELGRFHADWFAVALVMHGIASLTFGVAYGLLHSKLPPFPGPIAWGGLLMPILWTALSYGLMGVVNPVLQRLVEWPWFIASQFIFGVVAAIVVVRSEMVHIPPAGRGPDRLEEFVAGRS
jgi:hypothetical protein